MTKEGRKEGMILPRRRSFVLKIFIIITILWLCLILFFSKTDYVKVSFFYIFLIFNIKYFLNSI